MRTAANSGAGIASRSARLRTVSLRTRVVLFSLAVLGVVLVLVSVLAEVFVGVQSRADLNSRLVDRAAMADQLASAGTAPAEMVDRLDAPSIRVRLVGPDGTVYGARVLPGDPARPNSGNGTIGPNGGKAAKGAGPNTRPGRRAAPPGPVLRRTLVDGSRLTLFGDAAELSALQGRLSKLLVPLGLGGLAVAAVALLLTTRLALGPLDAMTRLARSIAAGDRGRRLAPSRTDTELGRTAAAFDNMLDALEGAERQAREAEALARDSEARTRRFVADAAHELRTPITGLRAAAEATLTVRTTDDERERLQLLLIREAARAGRLVEDLLALAHIDAGLRLHPELVELVGLAEIEAERAELLAPKLTVRVSGDPVTVTADPGRLAQVLANLLDNARRHTPDGGEITVAVTVDDRAVDGGGRPARVRVSDTGPGVPEQDRERIFDRLVRLDDARARDNGAHSGAGLGLAIARGIAQAHGGDLRCIEGATFELTLPTLPPGRDPPPA